MHVDAIDPLALHDGLGDPELVHAVAQRRDVLLDGVVLALADLRRGHDGGHGRAARQALGGDRESRQRLIERRARRIDVRLRRQHHAHRVRLVAPHRDRARVLHRNVGGGERAARILRVALDRLGHRGVHVDLIEQVQPAAQVEPERHGPQSHGAQQLRGARRKGQRGAVGVGEPLVDGIAGRELIGHPAEAHHEPPAVDVAAREVDAALPEKALHRPRGVLGHGTVVLALHLQRRILAKHVRQSEQQREQQHHRDQDVFPAGVFEHGSKRSSACPWA